MDKDTLKAWIGLGVLGAAVLYGMGVTVLLVLFGSKATGDALLWGMLNSLISGMFGWTTA